MIWNLLKKNRFFAVNIGNFGKHDISKDLENFCSDVGFILESRKFIQFPIYGFSQSQDEYRSEPLLIFKK